MAKKHSTLGMAALVAAGAGAAALAAKSRKEHEIEKKKLKKQPAITAILSAENTRKTAKEFIIQTATTKHLHVRKNQKA